MATSIGTENPVPLAGPPPLLGRLTPRVTVAAGQAGVWRMTYVDEELRVLFASGLTNTGKPARVENIYILKKN